jgi:Domain of unknown function (DUF4349)
MHPLLKKAAAIGFLLFLALLITGIIRNMGLSYAPPPAWNFSSGFDNSNTPRQANNLKQLGLAHLALPLVLEQDVERIQVYEKMAQLGLATTTFEEDQTRVRTAITTHHATILRENNSGLTPERRLSLEIAVRPEEFETLLEQLQHIGRLQSINTQLRDRTSEFRRLHAQQQSLKKHLETIQQMRGKPTSIDDQLRVEQRIQDIEKELQSLSGQLGNFLEKESFYQINVMLFEYQPGSSLDPTYRVPQRLAHAFLWALAWWVAGALVVVMLAGTYVSVRTLAAKAGVNG